MKGPIKNYLGMIYSSIPQAIALASCTIFLWVFSNLRRGTSITLQEPNPYIANFEFVLVSFAIAILLAPVLVQGLETMKTLQKEGKKSE